MAGDTIITVIGNLTADPELRFTPAGCRGCKLHGCFHAPHLRP